MAAVDNSYEPAEMLKDVNQAIYSIMMGGQSYQIGTRKMTRADLKLLYNMRNDLTAQIANDSPHLIDDTFVAVFSGR